MVGYLYARALPFVLVATKADKLSRANVKPQLMKIAAALKVGIGDVIPSSAEKGLGRAEIFAAIEKSVAALKA